jgi:uncharacterized protein YjiS (DUF1127 family)
MINMEKSASAHLPAARVWLQRGEGLAKAVGFVAGAVSRWVGRKLSALERAQARRMALRELYALDDRLLQDIGLSREQVPAAVNAMFSGGPLADATQPSPQVNAGDAGQRPGADASNDRHFKSAA